MPPTNIAQFIILQKQNNNKKSALSINTE